MPRKRRSGARFTFDAGVLAGSQYAAGAIGFVTAVFAARELGPAAYGVAAVIMAYPMLGGSLAALKTRPVTLRYSVAYLEGRDWVRLGAIFKLGAAIDVAAATIGSVLPLGFVLVAGDVPGAPGTAHLVALYSLSLPIVAINGTTQAILLTLRRFGVIAAVTVGQRAATLASVVIALTIDSSAGALVVGTAIGQVVSALVSLAVASSLMTHAADRWWTGSWRESWRSLHHLSGELRHLFGWNFVRTSLAGAMLQLPIVLLGAMASTVDAAYFRIATTITVVANDAATAMSRVAYPALASAYSRGAARVFGALILGWSRREALLGAAGLIALSAALPFLVPLAVGDAYSGMIPGLEVMMATSVTNVLFFYLIPVLFITVRLRRWVIGYSVYAVVALTCGVLLAQPLGFLGFALPVGIGLSALTLAFGVGIVRAARRLIESDDLSALKQSPVRSAVEAGAGARGV